MSNCNIVNNSIPTKKGITMNTDAQIATYFFRQYEAAETVIAFRPYFMAKGLRIQDGMNFMPIVDHPENRVILKPGEFAKIHAKHPDEKKQHLNNRILLRGTAYGVIVMHGREKEYQVSGKGVVTGPVPKLHTTGSFIRMAMRFFKRKGQQFRGEPDLLAWITSESFPRDISEQAALDRAAGIVVDDGLPPRRRAQHPTAKPIQPRLTSHDVKKEGGKKPFFKKNDVDGSRRQPGQHAGGYPAA
jgi:hypothetical protein